jgi:hypothetical protein
VTSKVYRTAANDFAAAENCVGKLLTWTPRVEDTSEGGLGSEPFYQDVARPRFHRKQTYVSGDLFRCEDCGLETKDMFRAVMVKTWLPSMVDQIFKPSPLFSYLRTVHS